MIAYFDTSAFVKLWVAEEGSEVVRDVWSRTDVAASSSLLYPEARAAIASAGRAARLDAIAARSHLDDRIEKVVLIDPYLALVRRAGDLAEDHALRGYDAVHLATALASSCELVVTADRGMLRAAVDLGLATVDANG